jgi:hypothetical protein
MAFRDIRKSRSFLSPAEIGLLLGVAVLLAGLLALNISLARTYPGGEWLYLRWSGARAFLFQSGEPYGSTIAERVQNRAYGREAYLNEYPYALNDPFYIVLLYTPLAVLPELVSAVFPSYGSSIDFAVVQGIWMLLSVMAAVGVVLLSLRFSEWDPPFWMLLLLIGFGLFSGFSLDAFQSASPAILLTFLYFVILASLQSGADELAGGLLFLVAYQWEVGALFFLLILILIFANRRWKVLTGFFMTLVTLTTIAILLKSDWMVDYARAVLFDWSRQLEYTAGTTLSYVFPQMQFSLARWLTLLTAAILFIEALQASGGHFRHIAWATSLALALNPLAGFAIFPTNHIVLLPAVVLIAVLVWERWGGLRAILSTLFLIVALLFSHSLYYQLTSTSERIYFDLLKILPPVLAILGLYWMRWWAIRPPRIWADEIRARR